MQKKVTIGLGSNVGDRLANLRDAVREIETFISHIAYSSLYESEALMPENAPESWDSPFYNMAVMGTCALPADELLVRLQCIENSMGRTKENGKWAPRIIDLDILTYADDVLTSTELAVPHPEMLNRDFVLLPLSELIPKWRHPIAKKTIEELAESFGDNSTSIRILKEIML